MVNIYSIEKDALQLQMEICIQKITGSSANSLLTDDSTLWCGVYGAHMLGQYDLAGNKRRESINYDSKT